MPGMAFFWKNKDELARPFRKIYIPTGSKDD
jgi:hypothetical protein